MLNYLLDINYNLLYIFSLFMINTLYNYLPLPSTAPSDLIEFAEKPPFNWNPVWQKKVLEIIDSTSYQAASPYLKKIFRQMKPEELDQLLKASASHSAGLSILKTHSGFDRLINLLTLEQIEAAIRSGHPTFEGTLDLAKEMIHHAKFYLELTHPPIVKPALHNFFSQVIRAVENVIDMIFSTLGFYQFEHDVDNDFSASYRMQTLVAIVSMITSLVTISIVIVGNAILGAAIAGSTLLLGGAVLTLYFKYLKPAPRTIEGCQNLTTQALIGEITSVDCRQHYFDEIASALISSRQRLKIHPLLIGPSGVGKTEILKGFAKAVAEGRYPELKGKQIFYINTADLIPAQIISMFDSPLSLQKIKDRIRFRREDVILIFDEIHEACRDGKRNNLAEQLKTLLDEGEESFPYVIGATTDKEFSKYVEANNEALARRFKQIPVNQTDRNQTISILNKMVLHQHLRATPEAIKLAYDLSCELFPEKPQPYMACRMLTQAITQLKNMRYIKLQEMIDGERAKLEKNISTSLLGTDRDFAMRLRGENAQIRADIQALEMTLKMQKQYIEELTALNEKIRQNNEDLLKLSINVVEKKQTSALRPFAASHFYMQTALENLLHSRHQQYEQPQLFIDETLITKVVSEELSLQQEKKSMLTRLRPNLSVELGLNALS